MATRQEETLAPAMPRGDPLPNGPGVAAFLAAGVGAFAMGLIIVLGELGVLSVPAIYAPAGGVTGRTTLAMAVWLITWAVLHARWRHRQMESGRIVGIVLLLTALGILGTFPPVWALIP
jgi:hypothetical protein